MRFAILQPDGQPIFIDDTPARLNARTRVVAQSWLPLQGRTLPLGQWGLWVSVNEVPLGVHPFIWEKLADNAILNQLRNDGEINDDLQQAVRQGRFRRMSLAELLADQED
ncbi:MAG: hypothetical protein HC915_08640 [Anaerolineae bacterium]|nr:hypothetical protein [Anaerolineae bacterium]